MTNKFVTEYIEKEAQETLAHDHSDHEEVVIFLEEEPQTKAITLVAPHSGEEIVPETVPLETIEYMESGEKSDTDELMDKEDSAAMSFRLPGSDASYADDAEVKQTEEKKETSWENDRDVSKFMNYIYVRYPAGIPKHNGKSILGCERAIIYLNKLNKEISEALRMDSDDVLDIDKLEDIRINILKDVSLLQEHIKKLKGKHSKKAEDESAEQLVKDAQNTDGIIKEATTPKIQLVMTPFERAISGIIINSVISAGHPFEDVYDFLHKKYDFTSREELSIMQLVMDMGFPIFKDRGTISEKDDHKDDSKKKDGVDYLKNYLS